MSLQNRGLNVGLTRMISMTDVELPKLLTDLEKTARALNEASGRVNTILAACENKIRSLNLGIEVWLEGTIDLSDDSEAETMIVTSARLGFAKVDNMWCLATKIMPFADTTNRPLALLQAPRKVRMGALRQLPRLVGVLSERAQSKLAAIERAEKLVS
jgi:hypothetical protein